MPKAPATEQPDIVTVLGEDHAALRRLADAVVEGTQDGGTAFLRWSDLMVRHEAAEELVVYPVLLALPGGAAVVDSCLEELTRVERLLDSVDRQVPGTAGFEADATRLVQDHVVRLGMEDAQVLPILSSRLRRRRKAELGRRFRRVSKIPPLHREMPVANRVGDLADQLRDAGVPG